MDVLSQVMGVNAPVFVMVIAGYVLRRLALIDGAFVDTAANLVFRVTMPVLFFFSVMNAHLGDSINPRLIWLFCLMTVLAFGLSWWWAQYQLPREFRAIFVQGAFRGNCGIMSFALVSNYYGDYGASIGGVLAGVAILLFNVCAVFIFSVYSPLIRFSVKALLKDMLTNPLIVSVLAGFLASIVNLKLPLWFVQSGQYFSNLTLPLALMCVGATLSVAGLKESGKIAIQSSAVKVFLLPVLGCLLAWLMGLRGRELMVLWFFLSTPTAAATFSMTAAAGGEARMAANIIAMSTVLSMVTVTAGAYVLAALGH